MTAGENPLLRGDINNVGMGNAVQRVMAEETGKIGKHFPPGIGIPGLPEQGGQKKAGLSGMHTPAAPFPAVPGLIHEPGIRTEERKGIRIGKQIFPDFLRQGGQDFAAEGRVNHNIRHRSHLYFLGANYPSSITFFYSDRQVICRERICDI